MVRATYAHSTIIARSGLPGDWDGVATHTGQIYINTLDGQHFRALAPGRNVEWETISPGQGDTLTITEDPEHPGFGIVTI